ncbi:MAG: beta-1,6-glucan synthase [Azoarcus sp.]|jgi:glucan 1,3-beta-glucosidase|nr:beta-1,6-glucan synthase [Azoarcus sp.]
MWATLALVHLVLLAALFFWLHAQTRPVAMHDLELAAGEKLRCVSYAPFHLPGQTPFDKKLLIPRAQIEADLTALSSITGCVRIYAIDNGLDQVPDVARGLGMKVLLGAWIGYERDKNAAQLQRAIALANEYPDTVRALIVGNEVLLRRERTADELRALLSEARSQTAVPVTYADVWEFWMKNVELADAVDFVTVHILPFWEDMPVDIDVALAHVAETRTKVEEAFAGKPLLIGETGWPSAGLQREASLPSRVNQARYIREFVHRAHAEDWDYNLIEAVDQPWKRSLEGTVGGYWGMLDAERLQPKFPLAGPVAERDGYESALLGAAIGAGIAFVLAILAWIYFLFRNARHSRESGNPAPSLVGGFADDLLRIVAATLVGASAGGVAILHWEHALVAYASFTDWVALGAVAVAATLAAVMVTLWSGAALAPANEAWRRLRANKWRAGAADVLAALRGFLLFALAVAALLLLVTPRYRDFPTLLYLTPAAIYGVVGWFGGSLSRAESLCAAIAAACVLGRWLPESNNPQALGWLVVGLALTLPALARRQIEPQQGQQGEQTAGGGIVG